MSDRGRHFDRARYHAMKRAWERFGLAIGLGELREIEQHLVAGDYRWIADLSGFCMAYEADFRQRRIYPVFNGRLWAIVTFLPSEAWACRFAIRSIRS